MTECFMVESWINFGAFRYEAAADVLQRYGTALYDHWLAKLGLVVVTVGTFNLRGSVRFAATFFNFQN